MFKKEHLENGIPVVMEPIKNVRAVAVGVWVKVGSRYEMREENGISHFLEHMFFKGTKKRTTKDIAVDIDSVGGDLNAFTSRENTAFYIKVLDEHLDRGVDLLSDICVNSVFPEEEIEKEKKIIKEESVKAGNYMRKAVRDGEAQEIAELKKLGVEVSTPDKAPFKKLMGPAYDRMKAIADALLKAIEGRAHQVRQSKEPPAGP